MQGCLSVQRLRLLEASPRLLWLGFPVPALLRELMVPLIRAGEKLCHISQVHAQHESSSLTTFPIATAIMANGSVRRKTYDAPGEPSNQNTIASKALRLTPRQPTHSRPRHHRMQPKQPSTPPSTQCRRNWPPRCPHRLFSLQISRLYSSESNRRL